LPYLPIYTIADVRERLKVGQTRENHWLDFKYDLGKDNAENARDIAQFANASGGALVLGAEEDDQVFTGFHCVENPPELITRLDCPGSKWC